MRKISILGTGLYLPQECVKTNAQETKANATEEILLKKSGVKQRYYANKEETASIMGAKAALLAVKNAGLSRDQIDVIISASGTMQMPIPFTSTLIHTELTE